MTSPRPARSLWDRAIEIAKAEKRAEMASELGRMLTPEEEDRADNLLVHDDVDRIHEALCKQCVADANDRARAGELRKEVP